MKVVMEYLEYSPRLLSSSFTLKLAEVCPGVSVATQPAGPRCWNPTSFQRTVSQVNEPRLRAQVPTELQEP